ncbi:MAG: hypothetical protein MK101_05145 [Phycisphaerales bacterium]|nr:hypothetical protein [Phycisphaerales bacterium]
MSRLTITTAGMFAASLSGALSADVGVDYFVTGPGGNEAAYQVVMSGVLGDMDMTCDFDRKRGYTWAGDVLLAVIDPTGVAVEFGGYDMSFGYPSAGDFPGSWDSGDVGSYAHSFSLGGHGLQGGGEWTVVFSNGYSGGLKTDVFAGTLTALGMYPGTEPFGGCCTGYDECFVGTQEECAIAAGSWLGENSNCENWPCGGAPEGACCFGTNCLDTNILVCQQEGGEFQGEGTACDSGICEVYGACCIDTNCTDMSLDHCLAAGGTFEGEDLNCADVVCPWVEPSQPMFARMVGQGLVPAWPDAWTVDLFIEFDSGGRLDAVAGTSEQPLSISVEGGLYQDSHGGPTSTSVDADLYDLVPALEWDSRVMIGALDASGSPFGVDELQHVGVDWTQFESTGEIEAQDGLWFILPDAPQGQALPVITSDCNEVYGVRIARLTVLKPDAVLRFNGAVQGRDGDGAFFHRAGTVEAMREAFADCNGNGVSDNCDIASGGSSDDDGDGVPDECNECPGDVDGDGAVDINDVLLVIANWGTDETGDLNDDGEVAVEDLLIVLGFYGTC